LKSEKFAMKYKLLYVYENLKELDFFQITLKQQLPFNAGQRNKQYV
jgi:hypothetical protein